MASDEDASAIVMVRFFFIFVYVGLLVIYVGTKERNNFLIYSKTLP